MEFTFTSKNIENTSTSGTIHPEQLLSTDRRPQTSKKTSNPPHNWVAQKEKEKEAIWVGPAPQGESCEGENVPAPWEGSSPAERLGWMEGELQSLRGESSNQFVEGKMESNMHKGSTPPHCAPLPETLLCQ